MCPGSEWYYRPRKGKAEEETPPEEEAHLIKSAETLWEIQKELKL